MTAKLDDTSNCPLGVRCESCGLEAGRRLAVYTCDCALGVMCLTMCPRCGRSIEDANIAVATAARLVMQHAAPMSSLTDPMTTTLPWPAVEERRIAPSRCLLV